MLSTGTMHVTKWATDSSNKISNDFQILKWVLFLLWEWSKVEGLKIFAYPLSFISFNKIGTLEYLSVIKQEQCTICKCDTIFKKLSLLKHIALSNCKQKFNKDEMLFLRNEADARKKLRRVYNPEKRALQHKKDLWFKEKSRASQKGIWSY